MTITKKEVNKNIVNDLIKLDLLDLILALGIMGLALILSFWQKLQLENQLIIATGRSILQLLVIGSILDVIFAIDNPLPVLIILAIMVTIATIVARNRISKKITGLIPIVWVSIFVSTAFTLAYTMILIIQPENWYDPQYIIPMTGMVLGNAMNSAALGGERLASSINNNRLEIETHLSLSATPKQAVESYRREAIRTSLIPTLNQMMVVGLVSLPGMFTGQVLGGSPPLEAASYQILILFMIALTNLITTILVTEGVSKKFFNSFFQLTVNG
jgi:putative ABC transport system permease protein